MSTFIQREVAKTTLEGNEVYICMHVHEEVLVNLTFFKKTEVGFEELLRHDVSAETGKELVRRVKANEVEKVTPLEAKVFHQSLIKHNLFLTGMIKKVVNKTSKDMKAEYVGEVAGIHYLVAKTKGLPLNQVYFLQKSGEENGLEIGKIPAPFVEMVLLDYIHHVNVTAQPLYLMVEEHQFVGVKKSNQHSQILYVVKIDVFPDSVSASKAYMISKKSPHEYMLLPIQESTPELMEGLKKEGKTVINQFLKQMNIKLQ